MAAALLLGAAEERHSDSPVELLSHMNGVLCRARLGGFATCLCVDLAPDGELTLANAGHLSPYRGGNEMETAGGLPLGITPSVEFAASRMTLRMGETLTFVSDGVLEARTRRGELFGFTRTAAISTQAAEAIAAAAQAFGQEDDITVLKLMRESVGPPASTQPSVPSLSV
jgi:serine phosphatase RsbU (regulator of sigma subunit)